MAEEADRAITRAELDAIVARVRSLEEALASARRSRTCPRCGRDVPDAPYCVACGGPLAVPAEAARAAPPSPSPAPAPARAAPVPSTVFAAPPPRPARSLENTLGQRFAPRLGAGLVFLGVVFFLGLAIQRGWIEPVGQLALATGAGLALIALGAWLASRGGLGAYPHLLEATGACVLYVTAFVAHALPYYRDATGLTALGSGALMALVALGTLALALRDDARPIAGLAYALAFLTSFVGADVLPGFTLVYVALLGTSLAAVVAWKGWFGEAVVGSLATGGLLVWLAFTGAPDAPPSTVAWTSLAPAAAFLWLSTRAFPRVVDADSLALVLTLATFAWAATATAAAADTPTGRGIVLLLWALAAVAHIAIARASGAPTHARVAGGVAAIAFWLIGAPLAWSDWQDAALLTTASYAAASLALVILAPRTHTTGPWVGALTLAGAAAIHALVIQQPLRAPWLAPDATTGTWQTWATLALVLAPIALAALSRATPPNLSAAALAIAAGFATLWTFALFTAPLSATAWLLVLTGALSGIALLARDRPALTQSALAITLTLAILITAKTALVDTHAPEVILDPTTAIIQTALVATVLLALYHTARARGILPPTGTATGGWLIAGSAIVIINHIIVYAHESWASILIGATGAAYLATGFIRKTETLYRYAGISILGIDLLRILLIDLRNTDLALRAAIFAILGATLLAIGYAYARWNNRENATRNTATNEPATDTERAP